MGCVIHEEAQLELRAPSKDHATSAIAGWAIYLVPETLVAETLVAGGEPAELSARRRPIELNEHAAEPRCGCRQA